jgi:hypothetical protein
MRYSIFATVPRFAKQETGPLAHPSHRRSSSSSCSEPPSCIAMIKETSPPGRSLAFMFVILNAGLPLTAFICRLCPLIFFSPKIRMQLTPWRGFPLRQATVPGGGATRTLPFARFRADRPACFGPSAPLRSRLRFGNCRSLTYRQPRILSCIARRAKQVCGEHSIFKSN